MIEVKVNKGIANEPNTTIWIITPTENFCAETKLGRPHSLHRVWLKVCWAFYESAREIKMAVSTEKGRYYLLAIFFAVILLFIIVIIIDDAEIEEVHQKRQQQQSTKISQENTQTNTRMNSTQVNRQADFALIRARERVAHEKMLDELDRRERESNIKKELDRRRELAEIKQAIKPKLHLLSWYWRKHLGGIIVEGKVRNISSKNLDRVMIVANFYTKDKNFITSTDTFIEFDPLGSGQVSPIDVWLPSYDSAIQIVTVTFKYFTGESIPCKYEDKYH